MTAIDELPCYCFHGSPGTTDDFRELEPELDNLRLVPVLRRGYPGGSTESDHLVRQGHYEDEALFCGYSWGAAVCLRDAAQHAGSPRAVILISPYLFPRPAGWLKRTIVGSSLLGTALLKKKGAQIVEELLTETAHPQPVPPSYRRLAPQLADPEVLRVAVQEKSAAGMAIEEAIRLLVDRGVAIACLWGDQDTTSHEAEQIAPLRTLAPDLFERRLDRAGHALLWTHPGELARQIRAFCSQVGSGPPQETPLE